ncbi:TonB-dependent receptor plug domain-containing protein [Spongiibacter marinus]|uniref:TonB-dependent receptor plug domain-containing protein n=1 Tax=Spongiibacter marinus TaxID=354246 RepID=UPI0035670F98
MRLSLQTGIALGLVTFSLSAASSTIQLASLETLGELSLEDLMDIEVVSASRRAEPLQDTAAAVFVLDAEDIRRSGARTLAEALRLVPGLQVARVDSHSWAVTARGFNSTLADKLEVLMDGRSLYTPLFSGVFWYTQDTVMRDIERIEVIRGPGAALWGANAVNGVVNIVTRSARDTLGGWVAAGGGGNYRGYGEARYGDEFAGDGFYRVYAKSQWHSEQQAASGGGSGDEWVHRQAGFRSDSKLSDALRLTVQGDAYRGHVALPTGGKQEYHRGENLIMRLSQQHAGTANSEYQLSYDRSAFNNRLNFSEQRRLLDFEVKHNRQLGQRQELVIGGGFRFSRDHIGDVNPFLTDFSPRKREDETYDLFIQDQINFLNKRLRLTLGAKLEHNDYSGDELQPSVRLRYKINPDSTVWAAWSRAVRIPNRLDQDVSFSGGFFGGDRSFHSEELAAVEVGYRQQLSGSLSIDIAGFYNEYEELRGLTDDLTNPQTPPPILIDNVGSARSHGVELTARWRARANIELLTSYRYFDLDASTPLGSLDQSIADADANDPSHQLKTRLDWDINDRWSLFLAARWIGSLDDQNVDAYAAIDMNVMWRINDQFEASVRVSNLNDDAHAEFGGGVEIRRSVQAQLSWMF